MTRLEVRQLNVQVKTTQGTFPVIHSLSFAIQPGEIVGLVGESGCGKSLTALSIPQLLPKNCQIMGGEICLNGVDLIHQSEKLLSTVRGKKIGFIFQDPLSALHPCLSIGSQLIEMICQHRFLSKAHAWHEAKILLQEVGLTDPEARLKQYPHELSGGMRQRAVIAIALAGQPDLLIADEPTSSLDATVQAQVLALIQSIQKKYGMSVLLISHDLGVIARLCDRVLIMYAGRIIEEGPVESVFEAPKHPYTQALIACKRSLMRRESASLETITGYPPSLKESIKGCSFAPRCTRAISHCLQETPSTQQVGHQQIACWLYHQEVHR